MTRIQSVSHRDRHGDTVTQHQVTLRAGFATVAAALRLCPIIESPGGSPGRLGLRTRHVTNHDSPARLEAGRDSEKPEKYSAAIPVRCRIEVVFLCVWLGASPTVGPSLSAARPPGLGRDQVMPISESQISMQEEAKFVVISMKT